MKQILLTNSRGGSHLFAEVWINDEKKLFVIDTGANVSFLFFRPLGAKALKKQIEVLWYEGGKKVPLYEYKGATYAYCEELPAAIVMLQDSYKIKVAGVFGLDYLLAGKIVLDFSKV